MSLPAAAGVMCVMLPKPDSSLPPVPTDRYAGGCWPQDEVEAAGHIVVNPRRNPTVIQGKYGEVVLPGCPYATCITAEAVAVLHPTWKAVMVGAPHKTERDFWHQGFDDNPHFSPLACSLLCAAGLVPEEHIFITYADTAEMPCLLS